MSEWCPDCNPWLIALAVMLPTFMEVLDTSIAAVALPHIAGSLSATTDEATWVLTSYLVANAVILPASSWFSLKFGRKRFLLFCIMLFTASSFLCGAATSLGMILFARAVQGAGGGALQPLSQAILMESFPPAKRGSAMAAFGLGVVVAPVLGPTLGGYLTEQYSWRWAFYINIPVGILAVLMISRFIQDPPYISNANPGKIDGIGLGLLAVWIGAMQFVLDKGQEADWFGSSRIRWFTAIVIVGFAAFMIRELTARRPLVHLRIFKNRNFAVGCLLIALFGGVIYGIVTILPLFYQTLLNYTAWAAGLAVSPRGIGAIVVMPIIGVLSNRLDNRWLILSGFVTFAWASWWMGQLTLNISQWSLLWPIILSGAAAGMVFVPLSTITMGMLPNEEMGNAAGLFNLLRNVGGSVGISVVETLIVRRQQIHRAELSRYIAPGQPFQQAYNTFHQMMLAHTGPHSAMMRAYAMIENSLNRQAIVYSYVDDLRYMAMVCVLCVPLVFLLKKVKAKGPVAAH
ncbi:MAG: DHA2 family efflux MFS transporter permease subunit [Bryobacteraceae bacterium]